MQYVDRLLGIDLTYFRGNAFSTYLDLLFAVSILIGHYNRPIFRKLPFGMMPFFVAIGVVPLLPLVFNARYHFFELFVSLAIFGISLFILLCEILIRGGARSLTKSRGPDWTKEIDYIYIAFGLLGLALTISASDSSYEK